MNSPPGSDRERDAVSCCPRCTTDPDRPLRLCELHATELRRRFLEEVARQQRRVWADDHPGQR